MCKRARTLHQRSMTWFPQAYMDVISPPHPTPPHPTSPHPTPPPPPSPVLSMCGDNKNLNAYTVVEIRVTKNMPFHFYTGRMLCYLCLFFKACSIFQQTYPHLYTSGLLRCLFLFVKEKTHKRSFSNVSVCTLTLVWHGNSNVWVSGLRMLYLFSCAVLCL